ncbi:TetR/AcrR family transcriptional regulator [Pseudomonas vanderleydeniana]|uniref:TetR/AcrR family transcriptional regulator n=1 Tax=Pseudomonas vanderleydeniana TaxID=2745495 RepID=A0A9E6PIS3_9PSED|nr:TetR/AcrR family transcriptional regulator [Pseudomonas vanderleydeniana]QXI27351.1 TetR/AcrR family transcriptional regulator [Pseudomonas vanderleydeniana]
MTAPLRLTDRKREAIIQAAIAAFRADGFEVASMDRIAAKAEVSKRTVYNHFQSKEELFSEILRRLWATSAAQLDMTYHSQRPLREQLRELLMRKMRLFNDSNFLDLARVVIAATIHVPERAQEMVARLASQEDGFKQWIRDAQADGKFKAADPEFASHQIYGLLKTFAFWPQITLGQPPLDAPTQTHVIESALDLFLSGYEIAK